MITILTTGQVARICKVAPRTVSGWFDSGRLRGYRVPGTGDRRIPIECLRRFLVESGMPTAGVDKYEATTPAGRAALAEFDAVKQQAQAAGEGE